MKKIILALILACILAAPVFAAEDWSQYESGRNNIRLDGYNGQPGYIAFTDGDGNIAGYLWASRDPVTGVVQLLFATPDQFPTSLGTDGIEGNTYETVINFSSTQ